jgi:hypothetical protein
MVELLDPATSAVLPGFEHDKLVLLDGDWPHGAPLVWNGSSLASLAGRTVAARVYFRDAIVYALSVN